MKKMNQGYYYCLCILLGIIIVCSLLLSIVYSKMLFITVILGVIQAYVIKKIINNKRYIKIQKEEEIKNLNKGYKKIYDNIYLKKEENKIKINNKDYKFSQIIDCELVTENNSVNTTFGKDKGKLKNNGKIKVKSVATTLNTEYCNNMYINVIVDDIEEPNIKINLRKNGLIYVNGKKYKEMKEAGNKIVATLKLIISKNVAK
nr:MAG TPA: hypothetical protein [Caudoviricetes sp.]